MKQPGISCSLPLEELHRVLQTPLLLTVWATRYGMRYLAAWLRTDEIGATPPDLRSTQPLPVVRPRPRLASLETTAPRATPVPGAVLLRAQSSARRYAR
jgi:hypothetical protein